MLGAMERRSDQLLTAAVTTGSSLHFRNSSSKSRITLSTACVCVCVCVVRKDDVLIYDIS